MKNLLKSILAILSNIIGKKEDTTISKRKVKIIPNGCKEYFFDDFGNFSTTEPKKSGEYIFKCIAMNRKIALRKYNRFKFVNTLTLC